MADAITQLQTQLIEISFAMAKCVGGITHDQEELPAQKGQIQNFDAETIKQSAQEIIQLIIQNDILISSLPKSLPTEQEQLQQIQDLLTKNQQLDKELAVAHKQALEIQEKISERLTTLSNKIYGLE
mmetsp:Transcript_13606/g.21386  ORF Transcript_13606/g.21386 Transcript_13606/m.21386 type:complete len:127 (+) Transcript_13606:20-400(+)|eukprot:CAMPEP_0197028538 /NCGR_PEP_ID=MMETSP1384-20130603/8210_1 /TAXON_ID=29189 /ORGANISM="Ammonia sp." /LENGTH=126 /DNA_ID=CAMNT_0042457557 /DNA_START=20 /DNA_END=400 /DNA_ORIENTATION=-